MCSVRNPRLQSGSINILRGMWGEILIVAVIIIGLTLYSRAATTAAPRKNAFGAVTPTIDPNITLIGNILSGELKQDADGRLATNLRVHPKYTYGLFDESILFCGDESARLSEADGAIIQSDLAFTYHRSASRLINGVPCYTLVGVDKINTSSALKQ